MLYLGIDLHAMQWTVDLGDEQGQLILHRQVSTRPAPLRKFLTQLQAAQSDVPLRLRRLLLGDLIGAPN